MTTTSSGFDSTSEMLSRETSRKICSVFSQMSSLLLSEISTLKARLERLEAELQSVTENAEGARRWRENVLSGCPVLFQQSGLLFSLKPFGRLTRRTAAQRRDEESSSAAQMDRLDEEPEEKATPSASLSLKTRRSLMKRRRPPPLFRLCTTILKRRPSGRTGQELSECCCSSSSLGLCSAPPCAGGGR